MTTAPRRPAARFLVLAWGTILGLIPLGSAVRADSMSSMSMATSTSTSTSTSAARSFGYSAVGTLGDAGRIGPSVVALNSESDVMVASPGQFRLGAFQVPRLSGKRSTSYNNTPFQFSLFAADDAEPIVLKGALNGNISNDGNSNVVAKFENPSSINRTINGMATTIKLTQTEYAIATNGSTSIDASFEFSPIPTPTPEPSAAAILLVAAAGWGWKRRFGRNRKSS